MPYSHKLKTRRLWADKPSPKHKRYNKVPHATEPSKCRLLCGKELEIPPDVPLRRGEDIVCFQDLKGRADIFIFESIKTDNFRFKPEIRGFSEIYGRF